MLSACARQEIGAPAPARLAIEGATVLHGPEGAALTDALVVIEGNRIVTVRPKSAGPAPEGARVVDARGKFLAPGLIDLHVHLGATGGPGFRPADYTPERVRSNLNAYLYLGITTVRSVGTERQAGLDLRDAQRGGSPGTARLFTAGRGFTAPGGHPSQEIGDIARQPKTPEDAREQVRELARQRVDLIKIWIDGRRGQAPEVSRPVIEAITEEAAKHRIPVHAHIHSMAATQHLLDHGGSGFLHMVRDTESIPAAFVEAVKARKMAFVPTLVRQELAWLYQQRPERFEDPDLARLVSPETLAAMKDAAAKAPKPAPVLRSEFDIAMRNLKRLADQGVAIAAGSDGGSSMDIAGLMTHREFELLVEAGLSPAKALEAATVNGALALGRDDLGSVAEGKLADLLLLDADPRADIRNLRKIHRVMLNGEWVDRETLTLR